MLVNGVFRANGTPTLSPDGASALDLEMLQSRRLLDAGNSKVPPSIVDASHFKTDRAASIYSMWGALAR